MSNGACSCCLTGCCIPLALLAGMVLATSAQAVPSFSRQTSQECTTCHVGAFGPQLTPYGIKFKLGGYTESTSEPGHVPLSGMLVAGYTHTRNDLPQAPEHFQTNNNATLGEASVFLAGRLHENLGAFAQVTWDGVSRRWGMDSLDLRYARAARFAGEEITFGASLNNRPTVQDPLNTTPVWSFPFTTSPEDFAPVPTASPVIAGALDGRVFGLSAYLFTGRGMYAEIGGYRAAGRQYLIDTNVIPDPAEPGRNLLGTAPYWRLAYIDDRTRDMYSLGVFGMNLRLRDLNSGGPGDGFRDVGIDANYQYLGTRTHVFTVGGSYIAERQALDETLAEKRNLKLDQLKLTASYHYNKTYGVTVSRFDTRGTPDSILYTHGKPDSNGWTYQTDWTPFGKPESWHEPWVNLRIGLQYTRYGKFDGSSEGASGNNCTYLFIWTAF